MLTTKNTRFWFCVQSVCAIIKKIFLIVSDSQFFNKRIVSYRDFFWFYEAHRHKFMCRHEKKFFYFDRLPKGPL